MSKQITDNIALDGKINDNDHKVTNDNHNDKSDTSNDNTNDSVNNSIPKHG